MGNLTALGELLNGQMRRVGSAGKTRSFEFATVREDLSLSVDGLRDYIPKGDYFVSLHLSALCGNFLLSQSAGDPSHTHVLPAALRGIRPGDRVLLLWVNGQPVVLDIIAGSKELTTDGRQ